MASYNNFQTSARKNKEIADFSRRPANLVKKIEKSITQKRNLAQWIYLYRQNIDIFCEFHFGVKLLLFQKFWLYELGVSDNYLCVASRGVSKSFIVGLFSLAVGVLYPGSEIIITAKNKKQAGLIIKTKIKGFFMANYPNIAVEIKKVIETGDDFEVLFHNGSTIKVVPGTDGARGKIIYDNINKNIYLTRKYKKYIKYKKYLLPRYNRNIVSSIAEENEKTEMSTRMEGLS